MKKSWKSLVLGTALAAGMIGMVGCDVKKTQEGEMPDVDVEGGQLPKYDVDAPDVDVHMEKKDIKVPDVDVDVHTEKREIKVPDVDVHPADDKENDDPNS
jgi:hypothetical protein